MQKESPALRQALLVFFYKAFARFFISILDDTLKGLHQFPFIVIQACRSLLAYDFLLRSACTGTRSALGLPLKPYTT